MSRQTLFRQTTSRQPPPSDVPTPRSRQASAFLNQRQAKLFSACLLALLWSCGGGLQGGCEGCELSAPGTPSAEENLENPVVLSVNANAQFPISPFIYGTNGLELTELPFVRAHEVFTFVRLGGNRTSTYNWENNASNAGADYHHMNDAFFGESNEPAAFVLDFLSAAETRGASSALITVPMLDYVAADKLAGADIAETGAFRLSRLRRSVASEQEIDSNQVQGDPVVQEEFVQFMEARSVAQGMPVSYSLDNEPGAWDETHPRLWPADPAPEGTNTNVTYAEHLSRSVRYAQMIRRAAPEAKIFGPASFGFAGWMRLADAPDANDRDYLDLYLARMAEASEAGEARLLDVLDVHFYSSVHVQFEDESGDRWEAIPNTTRDDARALRMQVARSLYDPEYEEPSWIVNDWLHEPIVLLPRLQRSIDAHFPGTELAITEYHAGGGDEVSGAVAQADTLGAFARYGVDYAAIWPLWAQPHTSLVASVALFRGALSAMGFVNDGLLSVSLRFGDVALDASSSDDSRAGIWASRVADEPGLSLVVTHRSLEPGAVEIELGEPFEGAIAVALTEASFAQPDEVQLEVLEVSLQGETLRFTAPGPCVVLIRSW